MAVSIAILLSSVALALVVIRFWRDRVPVRARVLVTLVQEEAYAIDGILWASRGAFLVLKHAAVVKSDGSRSPMDGDVLVERRHVAWIQYASSSAV